MYSVQKTFSVSWLSCHPWQLPIPYTPLRTLDDNLTLYPFTSSPLLPPPPKKREKYTYICMFDIIPSLLYLQSFNKFIFKKLVHWFDIIKHVMNPVKEPLTAWYHSGLATAYLFWVSLIYTDNCCSFLILRLVSANKIHVSFSKVNPFLFPKTKNNIPW